MKKQPGKLFLLLAGIVVVGTMIFSLSAIAAPRTGADDTTAPDGVVTTAPVTTANTPATTAPVTTAKPAVTTAPMTTAPTTTAPASDKGGSVALPIILVFLAIAVILCIVYLLTSTKKTKKRR